MSIRTCEIETTGCLKSENLRNYAGMVVCESCYAVEMSALAELKKTEQARVDASHVASRIPSNNNRALLDGSVEIRTDLFNADTQSIVELKNTIEADENIENKPYELAERLLAEQKQLQALVYELNEKIVTATNKQKAITVYMNTLQSSLRAEEREKLKLQDINYKPAAKPIKVSKIKTAAKKLDKVELRKYATELGIAEFTLQMLVVSKGMTVEQVANMLRKSINEAKSESAE